MMVQNTLSMGDLGPRLEIQFVETRDTFEVLVTLIYVTNMRVQLNNLSKKHWSQNFEKNKVSEMFRHEKLKTKQRDKAA